MQTQSRIDKHSSPGPVPPAVLVMEPEAREKMLMDQMPQVRYLAHRIHERLPQHVELNDLIQAGLLGLLDAAQKFDPAKKVLFKSYAAFRIHGAIMDSLRALDWGPRELRRKAREIENTQNKLSVTLGHTPAANEMAASLGLALHDFQKLQGEICTLSFESLHAGPSGEGEEVDLSGEIADRTMRDPFEQCAVNEERVHLAAAIATLPEKERQLLALYYFEELTMKEIALVLGVVESRVSQLHTAALVRLRTVLNDAHEKNIKKSVPVTLPIAA